MSSISGLSGNMGSMPLGKDNGVNKKSSECNNPEINCKDSFHKSDKDISSWEKMKNLENMGKGKSGDIPVLTPQNFLNPPMIGIPSLLLHQANPKVTSEELKNVMNYSTDKE